MNDKQFRGLQEGDVVRHKLGSQGFVVTGDYGESKIITRTQLIHNPREWDLIVVHEGITMVEDAGEGG